MKTELLTQFEAMKAMPMFEIRYDDYGIECEDGDEYTYTYISADEDGVWCMDVYLSWDEYFSLDEHLQTLFEMYIERLQSGAE